MHTSIVEENSKVFPLRIHTLLLPFHAHLFMCCFRVFDCEQQTLWSRFWDIFPICRIFLQLPPKFSSLTFSAKINYFYANDYSSNPLCFIVDEYEYFYRNKSKIHKCPSRLVQSALLLSFLLGPTHDSGLGNGNMARQTLPLLFGMSRFWAQLGSLFSRLSWVSSLLSK